MNGHSYSEAGTYRDTLQTATGCDSIIVTQLTVNPKPSTSVITGETNPGFNSEETYSVTNTLNSTYKWVITNGTQISGDNTNSIIVRWNGVIANSSVKVIETNVNGCLGDTAVQNVSLPVNLLSLTAHKNKNNVDLNWVTANEQNNKGFDVERSLDAQAFENIGFVKGNGTTNAISNYYYLDNLTVSNKLQTANMLYYRLKQTDFNGKFEYSPVVAVDNKIKHNNNIDIVATPNPFQTGFVMSINSEKESNVHIEIYDAQGKKTLSKTHDIIAGNTLLSIEHASEWNPGIYFISVNIDNERKTLRIVKY